MTDDLLVHGFLIEFCESGEGECAAPSELDATAAVLSAQSGADDNFTLGDGTENTLTLAHASGYSFSASDQVSFTFSDIADSEEQEYEARVTPLDDEGNPIVATIEAVDTLSAVAGDQQISLSWDTPTVVNSMITEYEIRYRESGQNWEEATTVQTGSTDTDHILGSLTNGTEYEVQVRALGDPADGDWPADEQFESAMPVGAPGAPVMNEPVVGAISGQVSLSWEEPADTGGAPIQEYHLEYQPHSSDTWSEPESYSIDGVTATVSALTNGVAYDFRVKAENTAGIQGEWTTVTNVIPYQAPTAPQNLSATVGDGQVELQWSAPDNTGGQGVTIANYQILYREQSAGGSWSAQLEDGDVTSAIISGLDNGSAYEFGVIAINQYEAESATSDIIVATPLTAPDIIDDLTLQVGDNQVILNWTAPNANGSTITGYEVRYRESGEDWGSATVLATGSTDTNYTANVATDGTEYDFQVRALTVEENGQYPPDEVYVTAETIAPSVVSVTTPGGGGWEYYKEGEHIDFTVTFDENVIVDASGGVPYLTINPMYIPTTPLHASFASGSGSDSLVFRYTVQAGDNNRIDTLGNSITLNGGTIKDGAGNATNLTLVGVQSVNSIAYDTIPPVVENIIRLDGNPTNADSVRYRVSFSEFVENVDVSDFSLTTTGTVTGTIATIDPEDVSSPYFEIIVDNVSGDGTLRLDLNGSDTGIVDEGANNPISGGFSEGEVYTIDNTAPGTPVASLSGGTFGAPQSVTLSTDDPEATIYYTTDGSAPSSLSIEYTGAISVSSSATIRAIAYDTAGNASDTMSEAYIIDTEGPDISSIQVDIDSSGETATITWVTDELASSQVILGTTAQTVDVAYPTINTSPRATDHSYALADSLLPCTRYFYQIASQDALGNMTVSTVRDFTTSGCAGAVASQTEEVIDSDTGGMVTFDNIEVTAPAGFNGGNDVTFQIKQLNVTDVADSIGTPGNLLFVGGYVYDIKAFDASLNEITDFEQNPVTITLSYNQGDLADKDPATLAMYHYHNNEWNELTDCTVDTSAKTMSCLTTGFSNFALVASASASPPSGSGVGAPNTGLKSQDMRIFAVAIVLGIGLLLSQIKVTRSYSKKD